VTKYLAALAALSLAAPALARPAADPSLRIVLVDVEGGAATLVITPHKHSLLIDTGWPAGMGVGQSKGAGSAPDSAHRIAAAVRAEGLARIDYLLITHYHTDHVGGAAELMGLIPVGAVIDHGPNREMLPAGLSPARAAVAPATLYAGYLAALGKRPHRVMRPGDRLMIDGLGITALDADAQTIDRPLGKGAPGADCGAATDKGDPPGDENPRSLGMLLTWGKARLLALGDTTWNVENALVCPRDLIGPVDLMIADNHGSANANSPQLINTVKPRVVLFNNGATKGLDPASFRTFAASPRIASIWQMHFATRSPADNTRPEQIANLTSEPDAMTPLRVAVTKSGTITVVNPRAGFSTQTGSDG